MVDYRTVMRLVLRNESYRVITSTAGVSSATVSKAAKALQSAGIRTVEHLDGLSDEDIVAIVGDGRLSVSGHFLPINLDEVIAQRTGRKKTALNVLWARYTDQPLPEGLKFYSYERFRQIVAAEVGARGLTARVIHSPGVTMQVDWAGTPMFVVDPVTGRRKKISIFVACLPYSGMLFATGRCDQRQHSWHEAHRLAFEYFGGVTEVVVPDNAATATTVMTGERGRRRINTAYEDFLAHYGTGAYATPPVSPRHKATVEASVKIVTNWVIGVVANRTFSLVDDLNAAITVLVDGINDRVPFRDQQESRRQIFERDEKPLLSALPAEAYVDTEWRKSKVAPNWHITIATCHYSVPYTLIGQTVDVCIRGQELTVMAGGEPVACHQVLNGRGAYSTDVDRHGPPGMDIPGNLWTTAYFTTQASRVGPATRRVIDLLFSSTVIAAQAYQPARNILSLGKGDNKPILEQACQRLTAGRPTRAVSYTAVKTMMAAIRAETTGRPTSRPSHQPGGAAGDGAAPPTGPRTGLVGGGDQFRLDNLPGTHNSNHYLTTGDEDPAGQDSNDPDPSDKKQEGC